jgi:DNA mismatch endonuclease (patch repair protein)
MTDIVSPEVRSRMMSGIRGFDTKPELFLRKGLHARGFRFRLHDRKLPGRPDLVLRKYHSVLFAHGCFWHGHNCPLFKWPKNRAEFWYQKITRNRLNDARAEEQLMKAGWRRGVVWECALKGPARLAASEVLDMCADWLRSDTTRFEVRGRKQ